MIMIASLAGIYGDVLKILKGFKLSKSGWHANLFFARIGVKGSTIFLMVQKSLLALASLGVMVGGLL